MEALSVKTAFELHSSITARDARRVWTTTIRVGSLSWQAQWRAVRGHCHSEARLASAQPAPDLTTAISQLQWTNTQQPQPPRSLTSMTVSSKAMQLLKRQSNPKILKLHRLAGIIQPSGPKYNSTTDTHPDNLSTSPLHRSFAPRMLTVKTLCSGTPERSDSRRLRALTRMLWETQSQFFFSVFFFFFLHSCIPGNAEGLRNHISDAPAAAAVTLLRVKEQACPQHRRFSSQSVPVEPQTRQGMGGSRKGGDDGGLILTGAGKSGRQHEEK